MVRNVRPSASVYQKMTATVCLVTGSRYLTPSSYSAISEWNVSSVLRLRLGTISSRKHFRIKAVKSC